MKPILFNTDMVRAILDNRKTVMRRVVKPQPICHGPNITYGPHTDDFFLSKEKNWLRCRVCGHDPEYSREGSNVAHHWIPPYRPSDILYVRETWVFDTGDSEGEIGTGVFVYKADGEDSPTGKWCPSIHMPKVAARIFLRVTDVRVERLQDIDNDKALKEGCGYFGAVDWVKEPLPDFRDTWDSTIKPKDRAPYGWEANPWVWVIEFERCKKPKGD